MRRGAAVLVAETWPPLLGTGRVQEPFRPPLLPDRQWCTMTLGKLGGKKMTEIVIGGFILVVSITLFAYEARRAPPDPSDESVTQDLLQRLAGVRLNDRSEG